MVFRIQEQSEISYISYCLRRPTLMKIGQELDLDVLAKDLGIKLDRVQYALTTTYPPRLKDWLKKYGKVVPHKATITPCPLPA